MDILICQKAKKQVTLGNLREGNHFSYYDTLTLTVANPFCLLLCTDSEWYIQANTLDKHVSLNQLDKTQIYSICQIVGFPCQGVNMKRCIQLQHLYLFTPVTDVNELVIVNMTVDAIIYTYALKVQRGLLYLWQKRSAVLKDIVAEQSAIPMWQYLQTWMLLQYNTFMMFGYTVAHKAYVLLILNIDVQVILISRYLLLFVITVRYFQMITLLKLYCLNC